MVSRKHNYSRLLAALCAFSGAFVSGSNSFATGSKTGKKRVNTSNVKVTSSSSGSGDSNKGVINKTLELIRQHPVPTGLVFGTGASGVAAAAYYLLHSKGIKKPGPGGPVQDPPPQLPPVGVGEPVFGSSLTYHSNLNFSAFAYDFKTNTKVKQYYYKDGGATNRNMRKAILKAVLFGDNETEASKKSLDYYLSGGIKRGDYAIFKLENGKYVFIFDARLFAEMSPEQRTAVKDKVFENAGFAVLGVEVSESKQGKATSYSCSMKNLGELNYGFNFLVESGTISNSRFFVFNKKDDVDAIKNEKLEDSLSGLLIGDLALRSDKKKVSVIKNNKEFIDSLEGFNAKAGDGNKKKKIYSNSILYDIGDVRLLVFNSVGGDVFGNLFKDKFVALGGYGFVVFEKNAQNNSWAAASFGDKYKITSRKETNFTFDFKIVTPN